MAKFFLTLTKIKISHESGLHDRYYVRLICMCKVVTVLQICTSLSSLSPEQVSILNFSPQSLASDPCVAF